jgi:hypothetical protein
VNALRRLLSVLLLVARVAATGALVERRNRAETNVSVKARCAR